MKGPAPAVSATLPEAWSLVSGLVAPIPAGIARTVTELGDAHPLQLATRPGRPFVALP
jgi:hypothetical protein